MPGTNEAVETLEQFVLKSGTGKERVSRTALTNKIEDFAAYLERMTMSAIY
jgi:hypothetical protein